MHALAQALLIRMASDEIDGSSLEFPALDSSLEVDLAEVLVVSLLGGIGTIEVEEGSTSEVSFPWVVNQEVHDCFLCTAAA